MYSPKQMGEIIRALRGDMPLREFAKKCDMAHTTIDNLEKGEDPRTGKPTQVKISTLQKIADACSVPLSYITGEGDELLSKDKLKIALFGGGADVTDEALEQVLEFAKFLKIQSEGARPKKIEDYQYSAGRIRAAMRLKGIGTDKLLELVNDPKTQNGTPRKVGLDRFLKYLNGTMVPCDALLYRIAQMLDLPARKLFSIPADQLELAMFKGEEKISYTEWLSAEGNATDYDDSDIDTFEAI